MALCGQLGPLDLPGPDHLIEHERSEMWRTMTPALFGIAYVGVLAAELLGDKTIYTLGTLATRYRFAPVALGALLAFATKMAVAVVIGSAVRELPTGLLTGVGAATFFATGLMLWFKKPRDPPSATGPEEGLGWRLPMAVTFAALFFSEWADPGQMSAVALVARYQAPVMIWVAAVLAMMTKSVLAIVLGTRLRRLVPRRVARPAAVLVCFGIGVLALLRVE